MTIELKTLMYIHLNNIILNDIPYLIQIGGGGGEEGAEALGGFF